MTKYLIILAVTILGIFAFPNQHLETSDNGRIVGGENAEPGQFPYIVSIQSTSGDHTCGGSIINADTIVTAKHCIRRISPSSRVVIVGLLKLSEGGIKHKIRTFIIHPSADIGLIKLQEPIQYTDNVKPIEWEEVWTDVNRDATAIGWGQTGVSAPIPDHLQYVHLKALTNAECEAQATWVSEWDICSYLEPGKGTCLGDSGGPLVSGGKLIGAVSRGDPCATGYPDIYTRLSYASDWIKQNL
ncbi:hypothetical protein ILUMI_19601 [Ignelater luminosus]|uniref:Peptidase S1 domain-containing protein n=1 Tax=Ignelater luminosus TaxID=2038154 RepID=A0A8K0G324_IGNLU|nr:hypothetical protein ILUMI_19601 [Ignelater luminosus]